MISAMILSAGLSSRFGSPKALAKVNNVSALEFVQQTLLKSQAREIVIVLGASANEIKPAILKHKKIKVVYNKDYILGQTSSFKAGLQEMDSRTRGVLLLPVDYPFIQSATIDFLIESFKKQNSLICIPTYGGKKGHPPVFGIKLKDKFLQLENSLGINVVAHRYPNEIIYTPVKDPAVLATFNTVVELKQLQSKYRTV